jgi:hypothetical protein
MADSNEENMNQALPTRRLRVLRCWINDDEISLLARSSRTAGQATGRPRCPRD